MQKLDFPDPFAPKIYEIRLNVSSPFEKVFSKNSFFDRSVTVVNLTSSANGPKFLTPSDFNMMLVILHPYLSQELYYSTFCLSILVLVFYSIFVNIKFIYIPADFSKNMQLRSRFRTFILTVSALLFHQFPTPVSVFSPVTTKCGRRGLVSSTPTFFAAVPASLLPRHTAPAQFGHTPAPRHPAPPHGYGGRSNRIFHSGDTHGTHIPHGSCRSSSES